MGRIVQLFSARRILIAFALAGAAWLTGCGGGGGGTYTAPPPTPKLVVRIAALQSAQEVPPVTAVGLGSASITVDADSLAVTGSVSTTAVNGVAAHIHDGAVGTNGPVIVTLTQAANGAWSVPAGTTFTQDQFNKFQAGALYVNVHTAANAGGEIRGQLGMVVKHARLNGAQVSPAVTTTGSGWAWLAMHLSTGELFGTVTLNSLTASAVRMHVGAVGANGTAVLQLTGSGTTYTVPAGTRLADPLYSAFLGNQLYLVAATDANAAGEVRGQVDSVVKIATLAGTQEVPANASTATGSGIMMLNPATRGVAAVVTTSITNGTAAHIHNGNAGANGPVIIGFSSPVAGTWGPAPGATATEDQAARFFQQGLYFNVHTAAFPGGEIRAQIVTNPS